MDFSAKCAVWTVSYEFTWKYIKSTKIVFSWLVKRKYAWNQTNRCCGLYLCVRPWYACLLSAFYYFDFCEFFRNVRNHRWGTWIFHISKIKVFRLVRLDAIEYTPQRREYMQVQIHIHSLFICFYYCSRLLLLLLLCLYDFVWLFFSSICGAHATNGACICENVCVSHRTNLSWMRLYAVVCVSVTCACFHCFFFSYFFCFCTVFCCVWNICYSWNMNEKWKLLSMSVCFIAVAIKTAWRSIFFHSQFLRLFVHFVSHFLSSKRVY